MPDYRYHISGQAIVTLDGRDYYLGKHGSPRSHAKYLRLLQEYNDNGMKMPEDLDQRLDDAPITVSCLTAEYRQEIDVKYADSAEQRRRFNRLCDLLESECGDLPVDEFGPRRLAAIRQTFIDKGNNRNYVNSQTRSVVTVFRFGVARELISESVLVRLQAIDPLKRGQTTAKEPKRRQPVPLAAVEATARYLSPTLLAMVRIHVATGMRSNEVCSMRSCDIDRSGEEWIYRPEHHKTEYHGILKAVPIVGDAREALTPFLRNDDDYCFSPIESKKWYQQQRTAARKTKRSYGNGVGDCRKKNPKRSPGKKFTKDSYRRAMVRAAKKAGVAPWTPHQIRHRSGRGLHYAMTFTVSRHEVGPNRAASRLENPLGQRIRSIETTFGFRPLRWDRHCTRRSGSLAFQRRTSCANAHPIR